MQHNDLSNEESKELYIVWEGLLATLGDTRRFDWAVRLRQFSRALELYETNSRAVSALWQQLQHGSLGISIVTYLPRRVAAHLPERLERDRVPHRGFIATNPAAMVRALATMPWLYAVVDPDPTRQFIYGTRGIRVPTENVEMLGWLKQM